MPDAPATTFQINPDGCLVAWPNNRYFYPIGL